MSSRKIKVLRARIRLALRAEIHALWRRSPIAKDTVFYESFSGNGMLGNPEAIFRGLLAAEDMAHLSHVWALKDLRAYGSTIREFADNPRIRFVRSGSPAYFRALATSEYLVNNATFPTDFGKRVGQTYLNTWHGTPLKRMGYDIPNGAIEAANTMRNLVSADYLLSASPYMTSQMYRQAYKLEGFFRGTIIEEGYPRIDRQEASAEEKQAVRDRLEESGIPLGDREIILYAPTWKGTTFRKPVDDVTEMVERAEQLQASLDDTRYIVLLKIHQAAHTAAQGRSELNQILVPNEIPTNLILSVSSTLITDYSSIYFDFLTTGRPILFYSPDLEPAGRETDDRPLYSRRRRLIMRAVVLIAVGAMVLPVLANLYTVSAATAADSCTVAVHYEAPDATGSTVQFEIFGAGGVGWECYATGGFGGERHIVSLGLIPGMVTIPRGVQS